MPNRYRIFETDRFTKDIRKLDRPHAEKTAKKIQEYVYPQLKEEPHYGTNIKKLKGWNPETWRYRIGDVRLFYEIDEEEKIVFVIGLEPRKDAY